MNFTKTILSASLLFVLSALHAHAQFLTSVRVTPAISGVPTTVFIVNGISTTNIPASLQVNCPMGATGFGLTVNAAGTNTATTTNATYIFEITGDGVNYATNSRPSFLCAPVGTSYAPFFTNYQSATLAFNMGNGSYVRLRSIQNTNTDSLFITNLNISAR